MKEEFVFSMVEVCLICEKKQGTNEPYTRYEDEGFSLCENCENNEDLKRGFNLGIKKARKFAIQNLDGKEDI